MSYTAYELSLYLEIKTRNQTKANIALGRNNITRDTLIRKPSARYVILNKFY